MGLLQPDERHGRGAGTSRLRRAARKAAGKGPKALVIHSLDHALAALRAAGAARAPAVLLSGHGAAGYAGPAWFMEVVAQARATYPGVAVRPVLDCADAPGRALAALRLGVKTLRLGGNRAARARVAEIARQSGAALDDTEYSLLDLSHAKDPRHAAEAFLSGTSPLTSPSPPKIGGRGMRNVGAAKSAPYPKLVEGGDRPAPRKARRKP